MLVVYDILLGNAGRGIPSCTHVAVLLARAYRATKDDGVFLSVLCCTPCFVAAMCHAAHPSFKVGGGGGGFNAGGNSFVAGCKMTS